jgi:hypothetical protein
MASVGGCHPVCPIPDDGGLPLAGRTRDRDSFAKYIVITHPQAAGCAWVEFDVLWQPTQDGTAVHYIIPTNCGVSPEDSVFAQHGSGADHDISLNNSVRSDLDVIR